MGIRKKKTTADMMEYNRMGGLIWFRKVKARANELANDPDHTFSYRDRDAITKTVTRDEIVEVYETAYSELAESFHGLIDRNEELESENRNLRSDLERNRENILHANNRIAKLDRRIEGFLTVIEQTPSG